MANIDVSFIIIEYHSLDDVLFCVDSIKNTSSGLNYEIIISSNSLYDTRKQSKLNTKYPGLKWSFNEKNNGFAYGMNCGIRIAKGEFIILQNPDTIIQNQELPNALDYLKNNLDVGILGPQILNELGEIQDTCRAFLTPREILTRFIKRKISKKGAVIDKTFNYGEVRPVNWVIGAYMITSKKAIEKIGFLDERFFMYVEDMDWCLRFWEKNLKVVYFPPLVIQYEGDRKSTLGKKKWLPFSFNKYTFHHLKNYSVFLREHGLRKIKKLKKIHS